MNAPRLMTRLRQERLQRRLVGPRLLRAFAAAVPDPFFVEIGANDGDQHDHLRDLIEAHAWAGIMVEPVPYIFERLRLNYGDRPEVALENAAIGERDGTSPFFYVSEPTAEDAARLPDWYDGIGSFDRDTLMRHAADIPDLEHRIESASVPCVSFDSLCRKHRVERIDLLVIDAEGYDARLVSSIDLERWRPRMLVYEHFHLEPQERERCRSGLEWAGYKTVEEGFDTWCVDPAGDRLTRLARRARPPVGGISVHDLP
jgi:FkbM family methyltransferase